MTKVSELTGPKLAEWTARAQGWVIEKDTIGIPHPCFEPDGSIGADFELIHVNDYRPDVNGAQAMELVKKFKIDVCFNELFDIFECRWTVGDKWVGGKTPMEAICRAVVASVYGEEVEDD